MRHFHQPQILPSHPPYLIQNHPVLRHTQKPCNLLLQPTGEQVGKNSCSNQSGRPHGRTAPSTPRRSSSPSSEPYSQTPLEIREVQFSQVPPVISMRTPRWWIISPINPPQNQPFWLKIQRGRIRFQLFCLLRNPLAPTHLEQSRSHLRFSAPSSYQQPGVKRHASRSPGPTWTRCSGPSKPCVQYVSLWQ